MNRKALISFFTGILLLLGVIMLDRDTIEKVDEHSRMVEGTYEFIGRLEQLSNHFKSAQIYSSKLAATSVRRFYDFYYEDLQQVTRDLDTLDQLAGRNARQAKVLTKLRQDIGMELPTLLQYDIEEIINRKESWRLGRLYDIHFVIRQTVRTEQELLRDHRDRLDGAQRVTKVLSVTLPLLAFLIIGFTFYSTLAENRKRRDLEKKLQQNIAELQHSNRELEQYAYVASHDLQEPLRKIRIFVGQLQESAADRLNEAEQQYLEKMRKSAGRMTELIHDILNYSSLRNGERFKPTDLNKVLRNCLHDLDLMIQQLGATISIKGLCTIEAIPLQMHQLFFNLVNNALKFARPGIPPQIHLFGQLLGKTEALRRKLDPERDWCHITVDDNGLGFRNEHAEQIFGLFKRLGTGSNGSGIGLALCRKVVENHGGLIEAQGKEGKGAVFHILLPIHQEKGDKVI
jgi:signal transduction histidine kinase